MECSQCGVCCRLFLINLTKEEYNSRRYDTMSDDWDLNGKETSTYMLDYGYKKEDIDTLREKLIEDIDTLDCVEDSKLKKWELIEEVLEIIDKRFGV